MKLSQIVVLSAFVGGLAGAIVQRVVAKPAQSPQPAASTPRNNRTLEDLSPVYTESTNSGKGLYHYSRAELGHYLDAMTRELIRPGLTEVEAERVAAHFRGMIVLAIQYNDFRSTIEEDERDAQVDNWLNQLGGDEE